MTVIAAPRPASRPITQIVGRSRGSDEPQNQRLTGALPAQPTLFPLDHTQ
jgi:hypothetical protein